MQSLVANACRNRVATKDCPLKNAGFRCSGSRLVSAIPCSKVEAHGFGIYTCRNQHESKYHDESHHLQSFESRTIPIKRLRPSDSPPVNARPANRVHWIAIRII